MSRAMIGERLADRVGQRELLDLTAPPEYL